MNDNKDDFDPSEELAAIRAHRKAARRVAYRPSRLDRFAGELIRLRREGASYADLQLWLRKKKRTVVHRSTVTRWIGKNMSDAGGGE
jgi:hypothetical protein